VDCEKFQQALDGFGAYIHRQDQMDMPIDMIQKYGEALFYKNALLEFKAKNLLTQTQLEQLQAGEGLVQAFETEVSELYASTLRKTELTQMIDGIDHKTSPFVPFYRVYLKQQWGLT
jgi:predicted XRE-type DNA-binding protein